MSELNGNYLKRKLIDMFMIKYSKKISTFILCALFAMLLQPQTMSFAGTKLESEPKINADSAIVYSLDTNEAIISVNASNKYYPVGMTKLMVAIIAVENADKSTDNIPKSNEMVVVGKEILTLPDGYTSAGFKVGDVVSLTDLITAMIVVNADDAAITIGAYIGRKKLGGIADHKYYNYDKEAVDYFVKLMNHKLSLLGISQTTFANCTGYIGGSTSHTTAFDAAKISAEFMSYKFLQNVAAEYSVKYWDIDETVILPTPTTEAEGEEPQPTETPDPIEVARNSKWTSINQLMNPESEYYYEYCKGITANVTAEGRIYISVYAEYHDIRIVAVVMDADPETVYDDVISLLNYVFNNYVMYTFIEEGQQVAEYYVTNAMDPSNEHLTVCAKSGGKYLSRIDKLDLFGFEVRLDSKFYVPTTENLYELYISPSGGIVKNDVLGTLDIYYDTKYIDTVVIYAGNTVPQFEELPIIKGKKWYDGVDWSSLILTVFIIALIVFIFILLISITNKLKKQKMVKQRYSLSATQRKPAVHYHKKKR